MGGRLFYVMGPSGAGKDSVLRYARDRLKDEKRVAFARRFITRAADTAGENHVALSVPEFAARLGEGGFLLHWASHGHCYGIGVEVAAWLESGIDVAMNGSREYLPIARQRIRTLRPVIVTADELVIEMRLIARAREGAHDRAQRIARGRLLAVVEPDAVVIENNGAVAEAGERLVALLTSDTVIRLADRKARQ